MEAHITSSSSSSSMDGKDSEQLQLVQLVSKAEAEKILYKFKDIPTSSNHNKKHINTVIKRKQQESKARNNNNDGEEEDLAQTNSLVFSCFHINSGSCKHLDILEPMVVRVCPPFDQSIGATSSDALLPLIDRSSSLSSSSSSSSSSRSKLRSYTFSKSTAKLHHGIHLHSITDKVRCFHVCFQKLSLDLEIHL